jgi:[protein-PII] uridylyltransferase
VLAGSRPEDVATGFPSANLMAVMGEGRRQTWGSDTTFTVVDRDRPGLFSSVAGVLALAGLEVLAAAAYSDDEGMATCQFVVEQRDEDPIDWSTIVATTERALDGRLALAARLARRAEVYGTWRRVRSAQPLRSEVRIDNDCSDAATVVDVHAPDAIGLLYRVTKALAEFGLDIRSAKVQTSAGQAIDSFYLQGRDGRKLTDRDLLAEVRLALEHALGSEEHR